MSEQASDDIDDAEMDRLFGLLALAIRRGIARRLLAGNDVGCFTTEQYRALYERERGECVRDIPSELLWQHVKPEDHLRSIPGVVREVAPGVWADAAGGEP